MVVFIVSPVGRTMQPFHLQLVGKGWFFQNNLPDMVGPRDITLVVPNTTRREVRAFHRWESGLAFALERRCGEMADAQDLKIHFAHFFFVT
jgi:hypothetical protein